MKPTFSIKRKAPRGAYDEGSFGGEGRVLALLLKDLKKLPILSKEEERSLAIRSAAGDKIASSILVASNIKFVVRVALSYWRPGRSILDLIQAGCIGLMKAVKGFKPAYEVRLLSYASLPIRWSILRMLADSYVNDENDYFGLITAPALGLKGSKRKRLKYVCCLNDSVKYGDGDSNETVLDRLISDDDSPEEAAFHSDLPQFIERLKPSQQDVLRERYWKGKDLKETGAALGMSGGRAGQIETRALYKLRHMIEDTSAICE
jgi:RNA polymerase primary sigma factor